MKYLSVCSGIEAASVAWYPLGWEPVGFAEIEKFPSQVLETRFPGVKNYGDMTRFKEWDIERGTVDLLAGGTPCQAFSVAGLRRGLEDPRGNLALTFVAMVDHYRPEWVVWENVPGVLSSNGGRDFGSFLGALGQLGYGFAYRVLDAQFFGVAQRRRRVFVVAHSSGDPRRAAEVLFEPESLSRNPPPSREAREGIAGDATQGAGERLWDTVGALCADTHLGAYSGQDAYTGRIIPAVYESHPNDSRVTGPVEQCPTVAARWGTGGNNTPLVQQPIAMINMQGSKGNAVAQVSDQSFTLNAMHGHDVHAVVVQQPMAMRESGQGYWMQDEVIGTIRAEGENRPSRPSNVVAMQQPTTQYGPIAGSLMHRHDSSPCADRGENVVAVQHPIGFYPTGGTHGVSASSDVSPSVKVGSGTGANPPGVAVQQPMAIPLQDCREMDKRQNGLGIGNQGDPAYTLDRMATQGVAVQHPMAVRRLTPVECERLQGFPDGWTDIKPGGKDTPDSPRYKALGNSMAVPVMRWIGMRIAEASRR